MRLLLDEMLPRDAARMLRDDHGHDAVHVHDVGLQGVDDATIAAIARDNGYVLVTENVADFATEPNLPVVSVLKRNQPAGGAQAMALAVLIDAWARANPTPYRGHHWPA